MDIISLWIVAFVAYRVIRFGSIFMPKDEGNIRGQIVDRLAAIFTVMRQGIDRLKTSQANWRSGFFFFDTEIFVIHVTLQ